MPHAPEIKHGPTSFPHQQKNLNALFGVSNLWGKREAGMGRRANMGVFFFLEGGWEGL